MDQRHSHAREPSEWIARASALGRALALSAEPITLVIGAGGSISSGAPSTEAVFRVVRRVISGRVPTDADLAANFTSLKARERRNVLEPLFTDLFPFPGYRLIAQLARSRRINVLNLNWDPLVPDTCDRLGVPCVSFDIRDIARWSDEEALPEGRGVLNVHLHGQLDRNPRFEPSDTRTFSESEEEFISSTFFVHDTVVIGASLVGDSDMCRLLDHSFGAEDSSHSVWYFGREDDEQHHDARLDLLPKGTWMRSIQSADIDFDRVMLVVLGEMRDFRWADYAARMPTVEQTHFDEIAWPRPDIFRSLLNGRVGVLVGDPKLGKTTLAHLFAYIRSLCEFELPANLVSWQDVPHLTITELAKVDPGTVGVLVLEAPFGSTSRWQANPRFLEGLNRVAAVASNSYVIVTCRRSAWSRGCREAGLALSDDISVYEGGRSKWYSRSELERFAGRVNADAGLVRTASEHDWRVLPAALVGATRATGTGDSFDEAAQIDEMFSLLEAEDELAFVVAVVRLHEYLPVGCSEIEAAELIGVSIFDLPHAHLFLDTLDFDGEARLRVRHDVEREAIERLMFRAWDSLESRLRSCPVAMQERLAPATAAWRLTCLAESGDWAALVQADRVTIAEWAGDLLRVGKQDPELFAIVGNAEFDLWSQLDAAQDLAMRWRVIRDLPGAAELLEGFVDRPGGYPFGAYAVLNACLYLQDGAEEELWNEVHSSLQRLVRQDPDSLEIDLALDALAWRLPPGGKVPQWARRAVETLDDTSPRWALVRFLTAYHPQHAKVVLGEARLRRDTVVGWTPEQAAYASNLIQWHFVNQSRHRAALSRQPWSDDALLRRALPDHLEDPMDEVSRLISSLVTHEKHSGWAFHLGCNLLHARNGHRLDDDSLREMHDALRTAGPGDVGIITAAATYESAGRFTADLRHYFADGVNRSALVHALTRGVFLDGTMVREPRFVFARDIQKVEALCGIEWPAIEELQVRSGASSRVELVRMLSDHLASVCGSSATRTKRGEQLLRDWGAGDVTLLELAAAREEPDGDRLSAVLAAAIELSLSDEQGELF